MTYQREKSESKHDATVADNGFATDIPALDENEHLQRSGT